MCRLDVADLSLIVLYRLHNNVEINEITEWCQQTLNLQCGAEILDFFQNFAQILFFILTWKLSVISQYFPYFQDLHRNTEPELVSVKNRESIGHQFKELNYLNNCIPGITNRR